MQRTHLLLLVLPVVGGALYLRSLASWRPKKVFEIKAPISSLVFSGDGETLLVGHQDLTALNTTRAYTPLWSRPYGGEWNTPEFFAQDARVFIRSGSQVVDAATGKTLHQYGSMSDCELSPDGHWLLYLMSSHRLVLKFVGNDAPSFGHRVPTKVFGDKDNTIEAFGFAPDGETFVVLASNFRGTHVDVYDVASRRQLSTWTDLRWIQRPESVAGTLQWARNGHVLLAFWYATGTVLRAHPNSLSVWRMSQGRRIASLPLLDNSQTVSATSNSLAVSTDNRVLGYEASASLWDCASHLTLHSREWLYLPREVITDTALAPDGSYLVAGTQSGRVYTQRLK